MPVLLYLLIPGLERMWMLLTEVALEVWELGFYVTNCPHSLVQQFLGLHRSLFPNKKLNPQYVGLACSSKA